MLNFYMIKTKYKLASVKAFDLYHAELLLDSIAENS